MATAALSTSLDGRSMMSAMRFSASWLRMTARLRSLRVSYTDTVRPNFKSDSLSIGWYLLAASGHPEHVSIWHVRKSSLVLYEMRVVWKICVCVCAWGKIAPILSTGLVSVRVRVRVGVGVGVGVREWQSVIHSVSQSVTLVCAMFSRRLFLVCFLISWCLT